ncbi:hypothetical protein, partial [uncultured Aquimarina sp.]|uniref:hypothetical protein n=1 Tax=uncultured Aquimarina sp. TaxID=575652 RepID=UPI0026027A97
KVDICDKVTNFGVQLEDLKIKTFVFGECNVTFLHKLSSNEIDLNKNGDVLIQMPNTYDGFIVTKIDSIPNWFEKHYPIKHNLHSNVIRLSWGSDVNQKLIKKAIENIADGYLMSLNKKSIMSFNKELCELSERETDKLKTENPFELELRRVSSS